VNLVCSLPAQRCKKPTATCDPTVPREYACLLDQYCNPATNRCEPIPPSGLGEPCGLTAGPRYGSFLPCPSGLVCARVHAPASGSDAGGGDAAAAPLGFQCADRQLDDGEACDPDDSFGSPCRRPDSVCYHNRCQQNGGSECTAPPVVP
jgi:hypothetical protein